MPVRLDLADSRATTSIEPSGVNSRHHQPETPPSSIAADAANTGQLIIASIVAGTTRCRSARLEPSVPATFGRVVFCAYPTDCGRLRDRLAGAVQHDTEIPAVGEPVGRRNPRRACSRGLDNPRTRRPRRAPPSPRAFGPIEYGCRVTAFAAAGDDADQLRRRLFAAVWASAPTSATPGSSPTSARWVATTPSPAVGKTSSRRFLDPSPRRSCCQRGTSRPAWTHSPASLTSPGDAVRATMTAKDLDQRIGGVASLAEPQRRALYRFVVSRDGAVSKDDAAAAMGVARYVAAFHLDRLVAVGLLTTEYRRLSGRRGPGAGRPAKLCVASTVSCR